MSISTYSYLVIGVPIGVVVKEEKRIDSVTRYNPITGDPYPLEWEHYFSTVGTGDNSFVIGGKLKDDIKYQDGMLAKHLEKLGLNVVGYDSNNQARYDETIIGLIACEVRSDGGMRDYVSFNEMNQIRNKCRDILASIGITESPEIYTIMMWI